MQVKTERCISRAVVSRFPCALHHPLLSMQHLTVTKSQEEERHPDKEAYIGRNNINDNNNNNNNDKHRVFTEMQTKS